MDFNFFRVNFHESSKIRVCLRNGQDFEGTVRRTLTADSFIPEYILVLEDTIKIHHIVIKDISSVSIKK